MIILYGGELIHILNQQASIGIQAQSNKCDKVPYDDVKQAHKHGHKHKHNRLQ